MAILYFMAVKITSLIEKIVAIIAPHRCLVCGIEDNILCIGCQNQAIPLPRSFCVVCAKPTRHWRLHAVCRAGSGLTHVWVGAEYGGVIEQLIHGYKFERAKAAYVSLGRLLAAVLPETQAGGTVVPIPTATPRIRQRGYDQTLLLAKELAVRRNLAIGPVLGRLHNKRQVGATRADRLRQSATAFYVDDPVKVKGKNILLVDDVCTTGSTLAAAAAVLRGAGAKQVSAVVCAWQPPGGRYDVKKTAPGL